MNITINNKSAVGCEVKLIGEVDIYNANELKTKLTEVLNSNKGNKVVINLSELEYIDSTGLGIFINMYELAQKENTKILLTKVRSKLMQLFKTTGLDNIFYIEAMEEK